jgi:hypothetical protein
LVGHVGGSALARIVLAGPLRLSRISGVEGHLICAGAAANSPNLRSSTGCGGLQRHVGDEHPGVVSWLARVPIHAAPLHRCGGD